MSKFIVRTAAFVVGSAIAGCVYGAHTSSTSAASWQPKVVAVYPGARRTSGDPQGDSADVHVSLSAVSLHIEAARYDTPAKPASVTSFYEKALARIGRVRVTKGGPSAHIEGFAWTSAPDQTTMSATHYSDQNVVMVSVQPRGSGSEFAIILFQPRPESSASGASPGP